MFRLGVLSFACVLLGTISCFAATVEPTQGNLYISSGPGFYSVNGRIDAEVGSRLMVSPGGSATVVYPDGCTVAVQPGAVTTIAASSPCTNPYSTEKPLTDRELLIASGVVLGAAGLSVAIYEIVKENSKTTSISP